MSDDLETRDLQRLIQSTQHGEQASAPRKVGPYELVQLLGQGAMGAVHRARDPRIGRDVALKLPLASGNDLKRIARLHREGQATAALDHPNVVRIHDLGEAHGVPFLAYELVEGARPLDEAVSDLPLRRRVELLRDAGRALGHAHARGVLHRDLKPENILVDRAGNVKVADFGLALITGLEALTMTGAIIGTPRTMAPEQIAGKREAYGPHTDVWALGVTLYSVLTDAFPFEAQNMIALAAVISSEDPAPPSDLVPGLAPELDAVCARALAKDPVARFADGDAFADALDQCLALEDLTGVERAPSRLPWLLAGAALFGVGLLTALVVTLPLAGDTSPSDDRPATGEPVRELSTQELRAGERELRLLRLRPPEEQVEGAGRWLTTFPGHPSEGEVRALRAASQLEFPLVSGPTENFSYWVGWVGQDRVLTCENEYARLWSPQGEVERTWPLQIAADHVAPSPDGRSVVVWGSSELAGSQLLWIDTQKDELRLKTALPALAAEDVRCLAHHPREPLVAVATPADVLLLELGDPPRVLRRIAAGGPQAPINALSWSPDGSRLMVGRGYEGFMPIPGATGFQLWEVSGGARLSHHDTGRPLATVWRPGSDQVACSTSDGHLYLLDGAGAPVREFVRAGLPTAHAGRIPCLSFSADGRTLYSGGAQRERSAEPWIRELRAWDVETGSELPPAQLPALFRPLVPVAAVTLQLEVSDDGRRILCAGRLKFEVWTLPR